MKMTTGTLGSRSRVTAIALLAVAGCSHYWQRPGSTVSDFERESAACIEDARQTPLPGDGMEQIYRACMRSRGWKRVEVSVAEDNQFRGPENAVEFGSPPPALGGRRYQQR